MVTVSRLTGVTSAAFAASLLVLRSTGHPRVHLRARRFGGQAGIRAGRTDVHARTCCRSCSAPVRAAIVRARPRRCRCMTYAEVRPWARSIKTKVTTREMPPWHIDRSIGEYSNDPSLSDAEVATIAKWVDSGAPEGRAADAPPARVFPAHDRVDLRRARSDRPHGEGLQDSGERSRLHSRRDVDPGLTEDRYVKWVQIIPDAWRARAPRARLRRSA